MIVHFMKVNTVMCTGKVPPISYIVTKFKREVTCPFCLKKMIEENGQDYVHKNRHLLTPKKIPLFAEYRKNPHPDEVIKTKIDNVLSLFKKKLLSEQLTREKISELFALIQHDREKYFKTLVERLQNIGEERR